LSAPSTGVLSDVDPMVSKTSLSTTKIGDFESLGREPANELIEIALGEPADHCATDTELIHPTSHEVTGILVMAPDRMVPPSR